MPLVAGQEKGWAARPCAPPQPPQGPQLQGIPGQTPATGRAQHPLAGAHRSSGLSKARVKPGPVLPAPAVTPSFAGIQSVGTSGGASALLAPRPSAPSLLPAPQGPSPEATAEARLRLPAPAYRPISHYISPPLSPGASPARRGQRTLSHTRRPPLPTAPRRAFVGADSSWCRAPGRAQPTVVPRTSRHQRPPAKMPLALLSQGRTEAHRGLPARKQRSRRWGWGARARGSLPQPGPQLDGRLRVWTEEPVG